jgi:hypothetical protein
MTSSRILRSNTEWLISLKQLLMLALLAPWLCLLAPSGAAQAQASLPYTPSAAGRHALSLLVDDGGLELLLTHWPVPAKSVRLALDNWSRKGAVPRSAELESARAMVAAELDALDLGRVSVTAAKRADTLVGFGDDYSPGSGLRLRGAVLGAPSSAAAASASSIVARVGARLDADPSPPDQRRGGARARLDDSAIAVAGLGMQLQAATRSAWWGPGWRSSLILGNNVPDLAAVSLQRAAVTRSESPWLSWLGPWNLEFFAAQAEVSDSEPAYPWLVGQRLTARPFVGWEIGLSRMAQWGGRGRPESAHSFWQMLSGKGINVDAATQVDPANELAGFDIRARCPAGWPCALYTQWIGEDMAHGFPTRWLTQYGVEVWSGIHRVTVEITDSTCDSSPNDSQRLNGCAYRNGTFSNGYASNARWLGASQGPDTRLLSVAWQDTQWRTRLRADFGLLANRPAASPVFFYQYVATNSTPVAADFVGAPQDGIYQNGHIVSLTAGSAFDFAGGELNPLLRWQQVKVGDQRNRTLSIGTNWITALDGRRSDGAGLARLGSRAQTWADGHPALTGLGLLALGVGLDSPADRYAQDHGSNPSMKALRKVGDALPTLALGLAGTNWLFERGSPAGDTALAATTAGLGAYASSKLLKAAVARDRPAAGLGASSFGQSTAPRSDSSMPSNHAAIAWAVVTPYAQTYDLPGLYALAGLTSFGRVMGREHWASDAVAGSLIGYHLGNWARTRMGNNNASLSLNGRGVALSMPLP